MPYSYENYKDKSTTYTSMRRAIGAQEIAAFFKLDADGASTTSSDGEGASKPIKVLDSGCGTGNYAVTMIRDHNLRHVHCTDYSPEMVDEARKNVDNMLKTSTGGEKIKEELVIAYSSDNVADMDKIPSDEFDCCMNNQVVHHLRPDNDFADLRAACKEWARVLKSGGKLTINFTPSDVEFRGMWWAELIPTAYAIWLKRTPSLAVMTSALQDAGFGDIQFKPLYNDFLYDPELYGNPRNFLDIENFRRSDSTFNLVSPEEINAAVAKVQKMVDDGTLDEWFQKREAERKSVGQTTTVFCSKK